MSAYAELPSSEADAGSDSDAGKRESKVEKVRGKADPKSKVDETLDRAERIADELGSGIGGGIRDASRALARARETDEALIAGSDFPELDREDALRSLAVRLDREGDLWRNLALREMTNARLTHRASLAAGALLVVGTVALAVLAALGAIFGADAARALFVGVGAAVLAVGAFGFVGISIVVRRGHREILRYGLARADLAELRLHRIAVAIAASTADPARTGEALARLERDLRD